MGKLSSALKKPTQVPPIPISFPRWEFVFELPTAIPDGAETLKGFHKMGEWWIFLKTPHLFL
jgi:hypothetical protein